MDFNDEEMVQGAENDMLDEDLDDTLADGGNDEHRESNGSPAAVVFAEERAQKGSSSNSATRPSGKKMDGPRLPLSKVKAFMKMDPNVKNVSADAAYLVAKATELFIQQVAKSSWAVTEQSHRKTIQSEDIRCVVESEEYLAFLEGMSVFSDQ